MVFTYDMDSLLGSELANRVFSRPRLVALLVFLALLIVLQGGAVAVGEAGGTAATCEASSNATAGTGDNDMGYVGP